MEDTAAPKEGEEGYELYVWLLEQKKIYDNLWQTENGHQNETKN